MIRLINSFHILDLGGIPEVTLRLKNKFQIPIFSPFSTVILMINGMGDLIWMGYKMFKRGKTRRTEISFSLLSKLPLAFETKVIK
jgi:hypothetical protein